MKRVEVRKSTGQTHLPKEATDLGLRKDNVIGFLTTKYNDIFGYVLLLPTAQETKEFGKGIFRLFSNQTNTTTIVHISFSTGMISFLDNEAYLEDNVKFLSPMSYRKIYLDKA